MAAFPLLKLSAQSSVFFAKSLDFLERFLQAPLQIRYPL
jgi:hypothetical protein